MIILDLEWNSGADSTQFDEILEIGAVRIDMLGGRIQDTFQAFCAPQVHTTLHKAAAKLPELQQSYDSGIPFADAYTQFLNWANAERIYAAWGTEDWRVLRQNAQWYQLPVLTGLTYDIQAAFSRRLGDAGNRLRLCDAAAYSGLPDTYTFHTALVDAMYTALLTAWTPIELLIPPASKHHNWMSEQFEVQPKRRTPRSADLSAVLDNRNIRKQSCPICGTRSWVTSWLHHEPSNRYYSVLCCQQHGCFLCRLTVSVIDNLYHGCAAIPPLVPHELRQFALARDGTRYICKKQRQQKRRRRRRKTLAE